MKLKLNKNKFKKHIENISKALPSSTALPSLYGILLRAHGNNITMIASDGNLSIKDKVEVSEDIEIIVPGETLIPGKIFKEVFMKQDGEVILEAKNSIAYINSHDFKTEINLLKVEDYPVINFEIIGKEVSINSDRLRKAIKNVSFAAADNDHRIILNGVNLVAKEGLMNVTATNSFRLAQEEIPINSNNEFNITLLSKNLRDFLPNDVKGEIIIKVDNTRILTIYENTTISSKLIDGVYPEVNKLIPTEFKYILKINVKEMNNVLEKALVMSESDKKVINLTINKKKLLIESRKQEMGQSISKTHDFEYTGEEFSIPFNAQFFKDALSKFDGEVHIMFVEKNNPFIIKSLTDDRIIQLILPHRNF